MDIITYFAALLVSFLGIIVGAALNFLAREEIKPGKKYFILLKKILLIIMILVFVNYFNLNLFLRILLYLLLIILFSLQDFRSYFVYPALGVLFYFSSFNNDLLLIQSILIFIYGLPSGTLFAEKEKSLLKAMIKTKIYHLSFIITAALLFLIF